eukprot:116799-Amphidinium_carterae.2
MAPLKSLSTAMALLAKEVGASGHHPALQEWLKHHAMQKGPFFRIQSASKDRASAFRAESTCLLCQRHAAHCL